MILADSLYYKKFKLYCKVYLFILDKGRILLIHNHYIELVQ
jgi:hypothetical protein